MSRIVRFDGYEVDLSSGELRKAGHRIRLREKSFQVLTSLLENPGEVVTREELRRRLWPEEVFVDFDNNLNTAVARLREALCDSAEHPRFVETLPKHGYRFIGKISAMPRSPAEGHLRRARLLVLPFLNLSGDAAQEYFSDAATDEIITALAGLAPQRLAVIARTTAMHYKGSRKDVAEIGRELAVDYVVEGGVHRTEDRVSVNVQLVQASDQTHLFAQKYDVPMREIFSMHQRAAGAIARHIPAVAEAIRDGAVLHEPVRRTPTEDLVAYNEFIKGRYELWKYTEESLGAARRHFEAALARDPQFVLACNALAELYWAVGFWSYVPAREADLVGRAYALRAIQIDSTSAEAHVFLSLFPQKRNRPGEIDYYDWEEIQKEVAIARELDPSLHMVRVRHAMVQAELGYPDAAAAELEGALESDPLSFDVRCWLAMILNLGRHFDRALKEALRAVELEPEYFAPYQLLGYVYLGMQRFEEAAAAFRKAVELSRELPISLALFGLSTGLGGRTPEARSVLDRLREVARLRYVAPTCFAWTHLGLGNVDEVFFWMNRAIDEADRHMEPIKSYPFLDPLRGDPRFRVLLRKMNLDTAAAAASR